MTADDGLRDLIRKNLVEGWHWTLIETGLVSGGVPDLDGCKGGVDVWVECKATRGWAVRFRPAQLAWLDRRARAGGQAWVAVRRRAPAGPRRGAGYDELWLVPGGRAAVLARGGLLDAGGLMRWWSGGPNVWNWPAVERALLGAKH